MGTEFYPEALAGAVRKAAQRLAIPIMVTEHGIATEDDDQRVRFIRRGLTSLQGCIAEGVEVLGYLHWSAFDNFEWTFGYAPRFGLIAVNHDTQERNVKESAKLLGNIARNNSVI